MSGRIEVCCLESCCVLGYGLNGDGGAGTKELVWPHCRSVACIECAGSFLGLRVAVACGCDVRQCQDCECGFVVCE